MCLCAYLYMHSYTIPKRALQGFLKKKFWHSEWQWQAFCSVLLKFMSSRTLAALKGKKKQLRSLLCNILCQNQLLHFIRKKKPKFILCSPWKVYAQNYPPAPFILSLQTSYLLLWVLDFHQDIGFVRTLALRMWVDMALVPIRDRASHSAFDFLEGGTTECHSGSTQDFLLTPDPESAPRKVQGILVKPESDSYR